MDMELRWIEIQFYQMCIDLFKIRNNIMDVMYFIDFIGEYTGENSDKYKILANEVINSSRIKPTREELIILSHHFKVPIKKLKEKIKVHNKTIYRIINEDKTNPRYFYPRLSNEQLKICSEFIEAVNKFKNIGI